MALVNSVKAEPDFAWVEPAYKGYDAYYGRDITGYLQNTNWTFSMSYTYYGMPQFNISAIRIYFDWGKNYTHRYSPPLALKNGQTRLFTISNMTPPVEETSELWEHSYYVHIDNVNSTVAPMRELFSVSAYSGDYFAVLSEDHLACLNLWYKYGMMFGDSLPMSAAYSPFPFFANITATQVNMTRAIFEFQQGFAIFEAGVFGTARSHLERGDSYFNSALNVWLEKGTALEDAGLAHLNSETNYNNALADGTRKQADASMVNSYGWVLFGLGWTFIGIGLIIYGIRKPKTTPS